MPAIDRAGVQAYLHHLASVGVRLEGPFRIEASRVSHDQLLAPVVRFMLVARAERGAVAPLLNPAPVVRPVVTDLPALGALAVARGKVPATRNCVSRKYFLIRNSSFLIHNSSFLIQNSSFLLTEWGSCKACCSVGRARCRSSGSANFIIFNTKFLVFSTQFLVFNTKFLVFN